MIPPDILVVRGLKKYFPAPQKGLYVRAVDGIDFVIREGEALGLVGESGSGKSTTAHTIAGMYEPTSGSILFKGEDISVAASRRPLSTKKEIQVVFQDPGTSLNPQRTIAQILGTPLRVHRIGPQKRMATRLAELLDLAGLPEEYLDKYPLELAGGERQMVGIARALASDPSLIVLDEPTSALDVSVQAKIINTLTRLQRQFHLSYLFITHDLSLMRNVATRVAIMYLGKIAEVASAAEFFERPLHPYTQMLISSIPVVSSAEEALKPKRILPRGEIPSPVNVPPGCGFHTRCHCVTDRCAESDPVMVEVGNDHQVRCHLYATQAG